MPNQYALPRESPMTAGTPPVSPSSRAAHAMLDQTLGDLVKKMAPQFAGMVPPDKAKQTLREVLKTGNFMEKSLIMSKMGAYLPKGVTPADIDKAVNETPPPAEKPEAPAPAPASAPAPSAAADVIAPPAAPTRGPTVAAAAAQPTGSNAPLDYLAQYGGHASVMQNGRIVPVHPGTAGAYTTTSPELAARLAAAGQAYQKETGKAPQYGEMSRGADVQQHYWDESAHGTKYAAASPGHSQHQKGGAVDLPDSGFRQWLYAGNMNRFGLHFPVKNDAPHVQADPAFKGQFGTGTGAAPGTPQPDVQAGAGPAAVAAAQAAAAQPSAGATAARKAFLKTIASGEATGYDALQGSGKFTDFSKHPGTGVAGLYQFKPETWAEQAQKYGYKDFKPETQDTAAWNYANDVYAQKTGRKLADDLASGDPATLNNVSKTLSGTWTSLPGGAEPNSNWTGKDFASVYKSNLGSSDAPLDPTPNVGSGQSTYDTSTSASSANPTTPDTATDTAAAPDLSPGPKLTKSKGEAIGDIFSGFGDLMAKGPVAQNAARPSGPANLPLMTLPIPQGPVPTVDPRLVEAQRQQLAAAMQRLNSGRLV